ncbi:MAG: TolB family protein [Actinomycetota bacterium]
MPVQMHRVVRHPAITSVLALVLLLPGSPASAQQRPGITEWLSASPEGLQNDGNAWHSSITPDGRYVAFGSQASTLVPEDANDVEDIFVVDRTTGAVERASVASSGTEGNDTSYGPVISAEGRFVAFTSHASNLVAGDTNAAMDVFVKDLLTGKMERASVSSSGFQGNDRSFDPDMTPDGRYVVFQSAASNLDTPDTNGPCGQTGSSGCDVFVYDRMTKKTERVSEAADGTEANGPSGWTNEISADGRFVSFYSFADNLVPGDTNPFSDIYVKDRATGNIEIVSVSSDGTQGTAGATWNSMSADGRYVAFVSLAPNLVPGDANDADDVFVHDRETRTTVRVSVSSAGAEANGGADNGEITDDGRYVMFTSGATNLDPLDNDSGCNTGDASGCDVYLHDMVTGITELVSVSSDGVPGAAPTFSGALTPGARLLTFDGYADGLVPGDDNGRSDIYLRDRGPDQGIGALDVAATGGDNVSVSGWATFTALELASGSDAIDAGAAGERAGGELLGARILQRPQVGDLFFRLRLASVGGVRGYYRVPGVAGPGVIYGVELTHKGVRYQLRASRAGPSPEIALNVCQQSCTQVATLQGGIGTAGDEVTFSLPLAALEAGPGETIEDIEVFTAIGGGSAGALSELDRMPLVDAMLVTHGVQLGIAPAGTPPGQVDFDFPAGLEEGAFAEVLSAPGAGSYDVWARSCLSDSCGAASAEVAIS